MLPKPVLEIIRYEPEELHSTLQGVKHPRKALYRARAHANPLSDSQWPVPARPSDYDWYATFISAFHAAVLDLRTCKDSDEIASN